ncbi:phage tail tape measure protein [Chelativorans intermedius]|uniref:Phage tail tape measure protein n=1 Tax=Chelativorans intermedius TaxID=515947 RepID=A0ABV6D7I6_9HYPH|nr:phage tail tape measure protein [Chelativorans intermedius]MCT8999225.1 phage tail tape measure protein [Chelativorans intermedius]
MANLTSTLTVRLLDKVTAPARKAARSILGIKQASDALGRGGLQARLESALAANNRALDRTRGRMLDAAAGLWALQRALKGAVNPAIELESALADLSKVSGLSGKSLDAYGRSLRKLATTEIPMAVTELTALSAAAAQSGVADPELFDFTRMTAKVATAWEMTGAAAGEALAKIKTQLRLTTKETSDLADAINHLADNSAASATDMTEFMRRSAAQGQIFGFTPTQTAAFGSAMIGAGAQPDTASTSFRALGRALAKGASATRGQRAAFDAIGLDAEDVARRMSQDALATTLDVLERLSALPDHLQASTMSALFGEEGTRALAPVLNNLELLRDALGLVADETSYLGSVQREFEKRAQTTEYRLQRSRNQLNEIGLAVGGALLPALNRALGALGPVAEKIAALAERFPALTSAVVLATGGLIGLRLALIGVRWAALMARGGLLAAALPVVRFGTWARNAATGAVALQGSLAAMSGLKFGPLAKAATAFRGIARAIPIIGGVLAGGVAAPVVAGLAAIAAAGAVLYKYWDRLSSIFSGVGRALGEQFAPALEAARPVLEWLAPVGDAIAAGWDKASAALRSFFGWLGSFFSREVLSEDAKAGFEQAGYEAATRMIEAIKGVFAGLVDWAAGLGSRIGSALGGAASRAVSTVRGFFSGGTATVEPRAMGGPVRAGRAYVVGERGPELMVAGSNGRIIPTSQTMALLRGGGSSSPAAARSGGAANITVNARFTISGMADPMEAAREVVRALTDELGPALRGVHADVGVS